MVTVVDSQGKMVPDRVRVSWGRLENFKCVDYFQVEYFQRKNPAGTVQMTPRINRHRRSVEIEGRLMCLKGSCTYRDRLKNYP